MHKAILNATLLIAGIFLASTAQAEVPFFNASCPGRLDIHADDGGPVFINGKQANLKRFSNDYYEARLGRTTISISINPDGSPSISYTGPNGANGICRVKGGQGASRQDERGGYRQAPRRNDRADLGRMQAFCRGEASAEFGVRPNRITTNMAFRSGRGYVVQGNYPDRDGRTGFFNCWFDANGNFMSVN